MFLCVFSFFLFLSSQKNSCIFRFTFFKTKTLPEKLHVFLFIGPCFFSCFSLICFSCGFLFDFSRSPSQHASISKCLLFLFISSFCSSFFHLFSLFCLLLFSRFFHLLSPSLNFLFGSFGYLHVSLCNKKSIFLGFCPDLLFCLLFSIKKKTSFSLFPFLLCFFKNYVIFPCLVFFSVLKNDLSFCITLVSFASYFELCFFFLLSFFFDVSRNKNLVFAGKCGKNFLLFSVSVLLV